MYRHSRLRLALSEGVVAFGIVDASPSGQEIFALQYGVPADVLPPPGQRGSSLLPEQWFRVRSINKHRLLHVL